MSTVVETLPDAGGHFGEFGGMFVPETLMSPLQELAKEYEAAKDDPEFVSQFAEKAMDAAACIGCGACAAACPSASAMLFVSSKISHMALLPQGRPEAARRALNMVKTMDTCGFGN